jgi:hypothetical protein
MSAASDRLIFLYWDDPGDSQESVDNQSKEPKINPCAAHARESEWTEQEDREQELRWKAIMQNGNEGTHYPEYRDYLDDTDEE